MLNDGQQTQSRASGFFYTSFPIRDKILRDVQVAGKDGLRQLFPFTDGAYFVRRYGFYRGKAGFVKLPHGRFVDNAARVERFGGFMDCRKDFIFWREFSTILDNVKGALVGTYRAISDKHVPRSEP